MILYRARAISTRPRRLPPFEGNEPQIRVRGRWFTSVASDAFAFGHATFARGTDWEVIQIDVPDDIVDSYRVATTPYTPCGLAPGDYADKPETEYVVPTFRTMDAVWAFNAQERQRDYIHVNRVPLERPAPVQAQLAKAA